MHIVGQVQAGYTNSQTGIFTPVLDEKNLVTYQAADIMAGLVAGGHKYQISHMYFEYINSSSGSSYVAPSITRSSGRNYYDDFSGDGLSGEKIDYIRVPIITNPKLFQSPVNSPEYKANGAYFSATSAAVGTIGSIHGQSPLSRYFASSGSDGPSSIYSVALVSAPVENHASEDLVFSRLNLSTPLTVLSGSQPTIYWSLRFS